MLICDTVDRMTRVGSAVAVAPACGAIPACRDRVCVIARLRAVSGGWRGAGRRTSRVFQLAAEFSGAQPMLV
eukprot:735662-Prymnesium_polylepis.1